MSGHANLISDTFVSNCWLTVYIELYPFAIYVDVSCMMVCTVLQKLKEGMKQHVTDPEQE